MYSCGQVSVIGKTNAGKSSLINTLVGEKVSIVSPKTQTTRQNIIGIKTTQNSQVVFVDTPGIHKSRNALDKHMMKNVRSATGGCDVLVYVVDASKRFDAQEFENIKHLTENESVPLLLVLSKIDLLAKNKLLEFMGHFASLQNVKAIIPLSIKSSTNLDVLLSSIIEHLPKSKTKNFLFDEDLYTNSSVRFMASEIVREKALLFLDEELPHGVAVQVTKFDETGKVVHIDVDLICEKTAHKGIILGKNGGKIKEIGSAARKDIENLLHQKVMLKIFVKVDKNWRQNKITMV